MRSYKLLKSVQNITIYLMEVREHSNSNGCMSLQYSVTLPRLILIVIVTKIVYSANNNFGAFLVEITL